MAANAALRVFHGVCDATALPQSHEIPSELLAEMTLAVRAFMTLVLVRLNSVEVRLEGSERRVAELEKEARELRLGWA